MIVDAEDVCGDDRVAHDAAPRLDVVGVDVGERLEDRQCDEQLADASRVLVLVAVPLGVAGVGEVGEVEQRHPVALHLGSDQPLELGGELRIGRRELEVRLVEEPQVDLLERQELARRALRALGLAELHEALRLEPEDPGALVAVERVGGRPARKAQEPEGEDGGEPDPGATQLHEAASFTRFWGAL